MDQKENKVYFSKLSDPQEFPELYSIQIEINALYAKILEAQSQMLSCPLITIEDKHKDFYNKFDKILK